MVFLPRILFPFTWYSWSLPTTANGIISWGKDRQHGSRVCKGQCTSWAPGRSCPEPGAPKNGDPWPERAPCEHLGSDSFRPRGEHVPMAQGHPTRFPSPTGAVRKTLPWPLAGTEGPPGTANALTRNFSFTSRSSGSSSNSFWGYTSMPLDSRSAVIWGSGGERCGCRPHSRLD